MFGESIKIYDLKKECPSQRRSTVKSCHFCFACISKPPNHVSLATPLMGWQHRFLIARVRIDLRNKDNLHQIKLLRIKFAISWNRIV